MVIGFGIRLLCVDYVSDRFNNLESVQFVFLGEIIDRNIQIELPKKEISSYKFVEFSAALPMLSIRSQRRLQSCLPYFDSQKTVYLENGHQP